MRGPSPSALARMTAAEWLTAIDVRAVALQTLAQFRQMLVISGLDCAENMNGRNIRAGESAIVHHLLDARAAGGDLRCQIGQSARPIADHGGEAAKPAIGHQTAFDDATEHVRIDVPAAEQENNALAGEFGQLSRQTCGEGSRGGTFHDAFLELDNPQNRNRDLFFAHGQAAVDEILRDVETRLRPPAESRVRRRASAGSRCE